MGSDETTQADEFAAALGLFAGFAEPSYPAVPDPPQLADHEGITLGLGVLSRWPITSMRPVGTPARHRSWTPLALIATLAHPAGSLPIMVGCLEYEAAYNDDRIAQAQTLAKLATDPIMDGPCPVIVAGDLNAAPDSVVLRSLRDLFTDAWIAGLATQRPSLCHPAIRQRPSKPAPSLLINALTTSSSDLVSRVCGSSSSQHRSLAPLWTASTLLIIKLWFVIFAGLRLDHGAGPRLGRVGQHLPDRGGEPRRVVQEAGVTTGKHSGRRPELLGKCFCRT